MRYIEENLMKLFEAIQLKFSDKIEPTFGDDGFCVIVSFPDGTVLSRRVLDYISDKVENHNNPKYAMGYSIVYREGTMKMLFY